MPATSLQPDPGSVVVACGADDRYAQPLAAMVRSVRANLHPERPLVVYLLDGGIGPESRERLLRSWQDSRTAVHWLTVEDERFQGLPLSGRMPVSTYLKLLVPDLLPEAVERALWLDCDLVVLEDIGRLWDTDCDGCHLLAVQDQVVPLVSSRDGVTAWRELALPANAKYFNAGVMLVNLARWRCDRVAARVFDHLRRFRKRVVFWDQEGLNAVLAGSWRELDPRWNHNVSVGAHQGRRGRGPSPGADPWILHFSGNLKPWVYPAGCRHNARYFEYLDQTAWSGWRPRPTLQARAAGLYAASGLRTWLYPAEAWGMQLLRSATRRYTPDPPART